MKPRGKRVNNNKKVNYSGLAVIPQQNVARKVYKLRCTYTSMSGKYSGADLREYKTKRDAEAARTVIATSMRGEFHGRVFTLREIIQRASTLLEAYLPDSGSWCPNAQEILGAVAIVDTTSARDRITIGISRLEKAAKVHDQIDELQVELKDLMKN